jgi:hypothetical protein
MKYTTQQPTPHVAIRLSSLLENFSNVDVIEEHNIIQKNYASVFFGKAGRPFQIDKFNLVKTAIRSSKPVLFILIQRTKNELNSYYAPLYNIYDREFSPDLNLIPKYYRESSLEINTWFQIGRLEEMSNKMLKKFKLFSNDALLTETLLVCRTALMLVKKG